MCMTILRQRNECAEEIYEPFRDGECSANKISLGSGIEFLRSEEK